MTDRETLTVHSAGKGWHRVETPEGDRFVALVKVAGVSIDIDHGKAEFECEAGEWSIEGEYEPWLLIEAPEWYTPESDK